MKDKAIECAALIGLCANQSAWRWGSEECARTAYSIAEAMMAERNRRAGT